MKLSIVTTLYQSEAHLIEFYERATTVAKKQANESYEIIFVNDGSPDQSLELAVNLSEKDDHVIVIDLSRNFGHHKAMMTGLSHASGEHVFLIDSDLEEEPEWLESFSKKLKEENCDVVYGTQEQRKGDFFERLSGEWFYSLFKLLTGLSLPRNIVTARLMTNRYTQALLQHQEREVFLAGLWHITGYKQVPHTIHKHSTSTTTYTFRKKVSVLVNSVTSFSNTPLVSIFYIGIAISTFAIIYIAYLVFHWAALAEPLSGWTSVMASIWLLGGMVISFIGIVGIYLSKIFSETKQRPYTIVRKVYAKQK